MLYHPGNPVGTSIRSVRGCAQHAETMLYIRSPIRSSNTMALLKEQLGRGMPNCMHSLSPRSGDLVKRCWRQRARIPIENPSEASTSLQAKGKSSLSQKLGAAHIATSLLLAVSAAHAMDPSGMSDIIAAVPDSVATAVSATVSPVVERSAAFIPGLIGDSPLREGIVSGFLLILFSELGDKTFFIAVLLALKESKGVVFAGTFGALAIMTVISVALGQLLHQLDELQPGGTQLPLDDILAVALLVFFGLKTINDARNADAAAAEEREEAEEEVSKLSTNATGLLLSTFALVFAAEWGDKSFLATIALAAASSPTGVVIGAVAGHGVATGIAVVGGSYLGKYLDEKVVQYVGGSLFLVFAAATVVDIIRGV